MTKFSEKQLNRNHIFLWAFLFTFLFATAEHFFAQYSDIDNFLISVVTNGVYSEENFTFFVHPFLCGLIKILRLISKSPDWYLLIVEISVYFSFFCLEKMFLTVACDRLINALGNGFFLLLLFVSIDAVHINFTVMTAVLCASGSLLILYAAENSERKFEMITGVLIWFNAFLFRIETSLVMLVFFILALLIRFIFIDKDSRFSFIKRNIPFIVVFVFAFLFMFISREIVIKSDKYEEGYRYSVARSSIIDYYESGTSYIHFLMDTDGMDADALENILYEERVTGIKLRDNANPMIGLFRTFKSSEKAVMFSILVLLFSAQLIYSDRKYILTVTAILILGFGGCIYYYFAGRLPERIILLFDIGMLTSLGSFILLENKSLNIMKVSLLIWTLLLIFIVFPKGKYMTGQNVFTANIDNEPKDIGIISDSGIYVWDVYLFDVKIMYPYWDFGKLFSPTLVRKHIPDGEWIYGQPYFVEMLKEIEMTNPLDALINRDDVYYVGYEAGSVKKLIEYYYYNKNIMPPGAQIGYYDTIPIYKFMRE